MLSRGGGPVTEVVQCKSRQTRNVRDDEVEQFAQQLRDMHLFPEFASVTHGHLVTNQALTEAARALAMRENIAALDHTWLVKAVAANADRLCADVSVRAMLDSPAPVSARSRLPWTPDEERAFRDTFNRMGDRKNARGATPWKAILREVHLQHPGVLDVRRDGGSLKDKARTLGLV